MKNKYDIVIAGGGTAGCACAFAAAKNGMNTLLIEKNNFLGGTMTSALVTPAMKFFTNKNINSDFFQKLMRHLNNIGGQITYSDGNKGWFNPELMKITLDNMLSNAGVDIIFNSSVDAIEHIDKNITCIYLDRNSSKNTINIETTYSDNIVGKNHMLSERIETKYLVDATGDAKIFEKLNLKFLDNFDKNGNKNYQPVNLRFIMSGIDLKTFSEWITQIDSDRTVTSCCKIGDEIHLSTACTWDTNRKWALRPFFEAGIKDGYLKESDSNYFQLFSIPGMPSSLAFNCPRLLTQFDYNDRVQYSNALKEGRQSIFRLTCFLQKKFKGFENAYISSIANSLGIRVSNRISGKYIYTIDDLKSGKTFDNPVLVSKYPVDIHSSKKENSVLEQPETEYMLPVESLMSKDYDNLFAIGRCISADFEAQAALRIIPSCFSMGEGLANYLTSKH